MPVSWFLLSLALGRSPVVVSLERLLETQDTARCSLGLSCHLWDGDVLCLPGSIESAPGPVLVPTRLQTELVLRCPQETDCALCVRVVVHLAVHGHWEEPEEAVKVDSEPQEPRNGSLQAQVVLSFQAYPTARCALLEVQVPAVLVQPGQSVGSAVFDCFEAGLGAEVRIWSYTQPRYQKELNLTQQLPALPWLNVSADGDNVLLVLDVSEDQDFGLLLYWDRVQGPLKSLWYKNLTGPQTITLNHTDLVPCLCIQVWPLEPDSVRTSFCPFRKDPRAHRNLWHIAKLQLLSPGIWQLTAPCSLLAKVVLCWQAPDQGPCQPLVPPMLPENVTVNKSQEFPLVRQHPNLCVQQVRGWEKVQLQECLWADSLGPLRDDVLLVEMKTGLNNTSVCALEPSGCTPLPSVASTRAARLGEQLLQDFRSRQCMQLWSDDNLGALWACPMDKYMHKRWVLVWLTCLLLAAALFFFFLLKKGRTKGECSPVPVSQGQPQRATLGSNGWREGRSGLTLTGSTIPTAAPRARTALLLHSADGAGYERLVGALASALSQMPLRVVVDLWSRRELSAHGALAWFHGQRRRTLQEDGVVILLFSPAAVAQCHLWLQHQTVEAGPHDALSAWLSCVLPDFLQGRAAGRYLGVYFDGLLHPDTVPAPFRAAPLFSLPSQLPGFLDALQRGCSPCPGRPGDGAERVAQALRAALDSWTSLSGAPGRGEERDPGPCPALE
ncbi:interleukin-17 receptor C isoform X3 [Meriones unguiculatus]|uniref:interleukin-17 receptor C isoform X3 n=1 Tax=Meriones unguiculatus TaxID=10047 RepID=UPI00293E1A6C|nr:interleukin-17 receptor C isoform X3 [Meriones unguiculatus]